MASISTSTSPLDLTQDFNTYDQIVATVPCNFIIHQFNLSSDSGISVPSTGISRVSGIDETLDLTSTTLDYLQVIASGSVNLTTFVLDPSDLISQGSVIGCSGTDTLVVRGNTLDLRGTTLSSIEILKAGNDYDTTFRLGQRHLTGVVESILGGGGQDTLRTGNPSFDLTSTTLSSMEILETASITGTVFLLKPENMILVNVISNINGCSGIDTLRYQDYTLDLTSTTISSIDILQTAYSTASTFVLNQNDLIAGGTVMGSAGFDTLTGMEGYFDLRSTTLSSVEILYNGMEGDINFRLGMRHLASGGSIVGKDGNDIVSTANPLIDFSSTTLSGIEVIQTLNTTGSTIIGSNGGDTIYGYEGNDVLKGWPGADTLVGDSGNDTLIGGAGADVLTGGLGADWYAYNLTKSQSTLSETDEVTEFDSTQGDKVNIFGGTAFATDADQATLQDRIDSTATDLNSALNIAAELNTKDAGVSIFTYSADTYAYRETTGSGTQYVATDLVIKFSSNPQLSFATDFIVT